MVYQGKVVDTWKHCSDIFCGIVQKHQIIRAIDGCLDKMQVSIYLFTDIKQSTHTVVWKEFGSRKVDTIDGTKPNE